MNHLTESRDLPDERVVPFWRTDPWRLRNFRPEDAPLLRDFFVSLSSQDRRDRFMGATGEVSQAVLGRLAAVDDAAHVAFLAEPRFSHLPSMIAEARYVVSSADPQQCEFAVCVRGDWQGRGLGRTMLQCLEDHAVQAGKTLLYAETLDTNAAMAALARTMGYRAVRTLGSPGCIRLVKRLNEAARSGGPEAITTVAA